MGKFSQQQKNKLKELMQVGAVENFDGFLVGYGKNTSNLLTLTLVTNHFLISKEL